MKLTHWLAAFAVFLASAAALAASTVLGTLQMPKGDWDAIDTDPVLHRLYLIDKATQTLAAIDTDTMQIVAEAALDDYAYRSRVDAARHRLYVLHSGSPGQITTFDGKTLAVLARTTIGAKPVDIAADFRRGEIYVVHDEAGNDFTIFDTRTQSVAATLQLGSNAYAIAIDRNGGKVYVPLFGAKQVAVVGQASRTVVKRIAVDMYPIGAIAEEKSGSIFVSGIAAVDAIPVDQLEVLDSATDAIRDRLTGHVLSAAGFGRFDPVLSPAYARAYISSPESGAVTVVDAGPHVNADKTIAIAGRPLAFSVSEDDGEVYATDGESTGAIVLDARLERVAGRIEHGVYAKLSWRIGNRLVFAGYAAGGFQVVATTPYGIQPGTAIVTEFHHAGFDHYFHSASREETRALEDGAFGTDWLPTQQIWRVYNKPGAGRVPVCRFYSVGFGTRSSHLYTPYAAECEALKKGATWTYEETSYYVMLPDAGGVCPGAQEELYRLYNNGIGGAPNHAYTTSRARRDELKAKGWTPEGAGPQSVFACTPPLKGFAAIPAKAIP